MGSWFQGHAETTQKGDLNQQVSKVDKLFPYNACPHAAGQTQNLLKKFQWDVFEYPPNFSDLTP